MEADTVGFKVGDIFNTFNEFEAALEKFKSTKFMDFGVVTAGQLRQLAEGESLDL